MKKNLSFGYTYFLNLLLLIFLLACSKENENPEQTPTFKKLSQTKLSGPFSADVWGYEVDGKEYAIVAGTSRTAETAEASIIDVTNPLEPKVVSTIPFGGPDVKVWDHYLYIAQGSTAESPVQSQILDISDPSNPVLVGNFPPVHNMFIDEHGFLFITGHASNPTIQGSTSLGLSIYDLKNTPANPEIVWTAAADFLIEPAHDISVIRNRMYVFGNNNGIYDVSNHSSPLLLGSVEYPSSNLQVHSGWVTEDDQYLFVCLEEDEGFVDVLIFDISDPAFPVHVGEIHDPNNTIHNLYIIGDYAYTSFYGAGLRIYDISDPLLPILIYEYDTQGESEDLGAFGVYPFAASKNIYVSDYENGLFIFNEE